VLERIVVGICVLFSLSTIALAGPKSDILVFDGHAEEGMVSLSPYLIFTPDDDPSFKDVDLDVSSWKPAEKIPQKGRTVIAPGWDDVGWFRVRFTIDETQRNVPLSLKIFTLGACEAYVDGKPLAVVGTVDGDESYLPSDRIFSLDPLMDRSDPARVHVLAMRVRTPWYRYMMNDGDAVAFYAMLTNTESVFSHTVNFRTSYLTTLLIPFGMVIALGALHLLLWLFDRREMVNLLYVGFTLAFSSIFATWYIAATTTDPVLMEIFTSVQGLQWATVVAVTMLLVSMIFFGRISKTRLVAAISALVLSAGLPYLIGGIGTTLWGIFVCIAAVDIAWLTAIAIRRKQEGAWIMGLGLIGFTIYLLYWFFGFYFHVVPMNETVWQVVFILGLISMPLSMSVFLARRITKTNKELSEQLMRVQELTSQKISREREALEQDLKRQALETENQRKTAELDEARRLQLSMLPSSMPTNPHWKSAIAMNTATEVGGDYVDYYVHDEGHITWAVGDATGHGLKAGVMVATAKSHFQTHALDTSHTDILAKTSDGIRRLHLRGLYMCLGLLTLKGNKATWSAAGIPPLLHYRAKTHTVEQRLVKGLPLGVPRNGTSSSIEFELEDGDVIVAMTDGLPELFNPEHQSLGYEGIEQVCRDHGHEDPNEIIDAMIDLADRWRSSQAYNDDVTLLVIKYRS